MTKGEVEVGAKRKPKRKQRKIFNINDNETPSVSDNLLGHIHEEMRLYFDLLVLLYKAVFPEAKLSFEACEQVGRGSRTHDAGHVAPCHVDKNSPEEDRKFFATTNRIPRNQNRSLNKSMENEVRKILVLLNLDDPAAVVPNFQKLCDGMKRKLRNGKVRLDENALYLESLLRNPHHVVEALLWIDLDDVIEHGLRSYVLNQVLELHGSRPNKFAEVFDAYFLTYFKEDKQQTKAALEAIEGAGPAVRLIGKIFSSLDEPKIELFMCVVEVWVMRSKNIKPKELALKVFLKSGLTYRQLEVLMKEAVTANWSHGQLNQHLVGEKVGSQEYYWAIIEQITNSETCKLLKDHVLTFPSQAKKKTGQNA
eukprot:c8093_g1_i2.p1 GENE.c8093_g1_i2~~c8093_g1_i2.p1  ORF type:complete len:366 (-),score=40.30 c8093_g1_i2:41-1138(-)